MSNEGSVEVIDEVSEVVYVFANAEDEARHALTGEATYQAVRELTDADRVVLAETNARR